MPGVLAAAALFIDYVLNVSVRTVSEETPDRYVAVIVPELVEKRWSTLLRTLLILKGGPRIVVVTAPWYAPS